jgi:hypothetical protein
MTSDGGVMLLAAIETFLGIAIRLAGLIADRVTRRVTHSVADILEPACFRPHQLPLATRQPSAARAAYRRRLARARATRGHPKAAIADPSGAHHLIHTPDQG